MARRPALVAIGIGIAAAVVVAAALWMRDGSPPPVVSNGLVRIDPSTNRVAQVIEGIGRRPIGLDVTAEAIWVVGFEDGAVRRVERSTGSVASLGGLENPCGVAAEPGGGAWVASGCLREGGEQRRPALLHVTRGMDVDRELPLPASPISLKRGGGSLWVVAAKGARSALYEIDLRTGTRTTIPLERSANELLVTPEEIWVSNFEQQSISRIRPRVPGTVTFEAGNGPAGMAVAGNAFWVANYRDGTVWKLAPGTKAFISAVDLPGEGPYFMTATPGALWVATVDAGGVVRVDPETGRVVEKISLGGRRSHSFAIDAGPEGDVWVAVSQTEMDD